MAYYISVYYYNKMLLWPIDKQKVETQGITCYIYEIVKKIKPPVKQWLVPDIGASPGSLNDLK